MHENMHFARKYSVMRIERTHSRSHAISLLLIARCHALVVEFWSGVFSLLKPSCD